MKLSDFFSDAGKPVAYYPSLAKVLGGVKQAILICQLLYWTGKQSDKNGWIYKSTEEIEDETGLGWEEQKTARKRLLALNVIEETYERIQHRMKYRVMKDALNSLWENKQKEAKQTPRLSGKVQFGNQGKSNSRIRRNPTPNQGKSNRLSGKVQFVKGTENTTENTYTDANASPHSRLMKFLFTECGAYPDGAAQGKAVKWLLDNKFSPEACEACLKGLKAEAWRTNRISWLTVQKEIASWLQKNPKFETPEKKAKEEAFQFEMQRMVATLGCDVCETVKGKSKFPFGKGCLAYPYGKGLAPPCPGCNPRHESHPNHAKYLEVKALKESA